MLAFLLTLLTFSGRCQAAIASHTIMAPTRASLTESERNSLRFHLENLWNEMEALSRNKKSDLLDIRRQNREFVMFSIFDRIPFETRLPELEKELTESGQIRKISVTGLRIISRSGPPRALPAIVHTDDRSFSLNDNEIAEELRLEVRGQGQAAQFKQWLDAWKYDLTRIVEPVGTPVITDKGWTVRARTWRFYKVRLPRLIPRDPMELFPYWGRQNLKLFARSEPAIWALANRIKTRQKFDRALAEPYRNRARFLLNAARMSFFLKKTPTT